MDYSECVKSKRYLLEQVASSIIMELAAPDTTAQ